MDERRSDAAILHASVHFESSLNAYGPKAGAYEVFRFVAERNNAPGDWLAVRSLRNGHEKPVEVVGKGRTRHDGRSLIYLWRTLLFI